MSGMSYFTLFFLMCGIITEYLMREIGRSNGFWYGMVFGPLGFFAVLYCLTADLFKELQKELKEINSMNLPNVS